MDDFMTEELEQFRNVLVKYGLDVRYYFERLAKEGQLAIPTFTFEEREISGFELIAEINGKTAYYATLSTNQRFIYVE